MEYAKIFILFYCVFYFAHSSPVNDEEEEIRKLLLEFGIQLHDATSKEKAMAYRIIHERDSAKKELSAIVKAERESVNKELSDKVKAERESELLMHDYLKLLALGQIQSRLNLIKSLCDDDDAPKGQSAAETWLNILKHSEMPHAFQLRLRLKAAGLAYNVFAKHAQTFEEDIKTDRHPEFRKRLSEKDVEIAFEDIAMEPSMKDAASVILVQFPRNTVTFQDPDGLLISTFECVEFTKVPGGTRLSNLINAILELTTEEKEQILANPILNERGEFLGNTVMCFQDHDTAYKFWNKTEVVTLKQKDVIMNVGFRMSEKTKSEWFPSNSDAGTAGTG
ncbi:uncharacterized protein LOC135844170 isoform X2 [Planococcus citri]|uniref:uncharacterized protein LOC135844170 isoform X2 n=1 Tax=Planococcus citri TaxID=170843 RepID=UPI0031F99C8E